MNEITEFPEKSRIVILGAGFSGLATLSNLLKRLGKKTNTEIILIDQNNYFMFVPLLHQVAVGVLHPWDIITPIRILDFGKQTKFIQARVENIDLTQRKISTSYGDYCFDYLVLSLGSEPDTSRRINKELTENEFTLRTLDDSTAIKNHIFSMFETASLEKDPTTRRELLSFIIVGGGYTGTELVAGFSDMVYKYAIKYYKAIQPEEIQISVIEAKSRIISDLPDECSAYITRHLERHNIRLYLNSKISSVSDTWIEVNNSERIPTRTIIWTTGVSANSVVAKIDCQHDDMGRLVVDDFLSVSGHSGVYAIGDCAHFFDEVTGAVAAPRAHHAVRHAKITAINICAEIKREKRQKYQFTDSMLIVSIGRSNALFRFYKFWIRGLPALLVWVAAYSLLVTGIKNRFKIAIDWILSRIFGPDMTVTLPEKKRELKR